MLIKHHYQPEKETVRSFGLTDPVSGSKIVVLARRIPEPFAADRLQHVQFKAGGVWWMVVYSLSEPGLRSEVVRNPGKFTRLSGYLSEPGFTGHTEPRPLESFLVSRETSYPSHPNAGSLRGPGDLFDGPPARVPFLEAHGYHFPTTAEHLLFTRLQQKIKTLKAVKRLRNQPDWQNTLNNAQVALDLAGMVPVIGNAADLINLCISLARGNYGEAAMNAVSLIPGSQLVTAGKLAIRQGRRWRKVGRMKVKKREVPEGRVTGKEVISGSDLETKKAGKKFIGGAYGKIEGKDATGFEKHHIPADAISPLSKYKGGAIQIEPNDHKFTASYGSSRAAKYYRSKQKELIENGDFMAAFEMDVRDLISKFGSKYNDAIQKAREYYIKEGIFK